MPFEKVNARGGIKQGAFSLTKGVGTFSLTNEKQGLFAGNENAVKGPGTAIPSPAEGGMRFGLQSFILKGGHSRYI